MLKGYPWQRPIVQGCPTVALLHKRATGTPKNVQQDVLQLLFNSKQHQKSVLDVSIAFSQQIVLGNT